MPRKARLLLPHTPHHIVQRGHNRSSVFADHADYRYYLGTLREWKEKLSIKVFAYCLMTNHVHLIVEPGEHVEVVGKLMRRLAGRQTRYVNSLEHRTGTLWEGRYKASPIQTERYLLACSRYVELNPIRAGMILSPGDYLWSSYHSKPGCREEWLDEDPCYRALALDRQGCETEYKRFVGEGVSDEERELIVGAISRNQLTGDGRFVDEVAQRIGRRVHFRGRGRPSCPGK